MREIRFFNFHAFNDNDTEVGSWSGYPFEGDKVEAAAKHRALALLKNHPNARRVVFYERGINSRPAVRSATKI